MTGTGRGPSYPEGSECAIENCHGRPKARWWCQSHYNRWKRTKSPDEGPRNRAQNSIPPPCDASGCQREARSRDGYCGLHDMRLRNTGTVERVVTTNTERFWGKVTKGDFISPERPDLGPCWIFHGTRVNGYGTFWLDGKSVSAHRHSYTLTHGSIPEGMTLDHLCYTRNCVNPSHLDPVTISENVTRAHGKLHYVVITESARS